MNRIVESLFRFFAFAASVAGAMIGFLALCGIVGVAGPILIGVFSGVSLLVLFLWSGTRLISYLLLGDDPEYQEWRKHNDPWFDTLPPPFRAPNTKAPYYCLRCGADMWELIGICSSCGYGEHEMVCFNCNITVSEPFDGAFKTCGVICPGCKGILKT